MVVRVHLLAPRTIVNGGNMNGNDLIELFEYAYDYYEDNDYDPSVDVSHSNDDEIGFDYSDILDPLRLASVYGDSECLSTQCTPCVL